MSKRVVVDLREYFLERQREVEARRAAGEIRLDSLQQRPNADRRKVEAAPCRSGGGGSVA